MDSVEAHKARGDHYEVEHRTALDAIDIIERRERATELTLRCVRGVLAVREKELLDLKGPCSNKRCRLHYAHSGPCDTQRAEVPQPAPAEHEPILATWSWHPPANAWHLFCRCGKKFDDSIHDVSAGAGSGAGSTQDGDDDAR